MSGNNKHSAAQGPQQARYSSSPFVANGPIKQDGIGLFPPPPHYRMMAPQQRSDQYQVTSPAGSYGAQGQAQGPGNLRAMTSAGPPNQSSTPPNADLKVQTMPSQMPQMQFVTQVRPTQPQYFRGAAPPNQGTRMPTHQQRPQAPPQFIVHPGYVHPTQQVYLQNPVMYTPQNAQSQQTARFVTSSFPVYTTGGQQLSYQAYMTPQATSTVPTYAPLYYPNQSAPIMNRAPVQQPAAAPPAQVAANTLSAAQLGMPPQTNQHNSMPRNRERRKNAIAIIDPNTGHNVLNDVLGDSSQPNSGESSARQTPKPNHNPAQRQEAKEIISLIDSNTGQNILNNVLVVSSQPNSGELPAGRMLDTSLNPVQNPEAKKIIPIIDPNTGRNILDDMSTGSSQPNSSELFARQTLEPNDNPIQEAEKIQATFIKQVALSISEERSNASKDPPPIHNEPSSYPSNEYHPPLSNAPSVHSQRYDVQSSNLHINAKEFVSSSKLSAKDTTPVVSANTDAEEVIIPKKETSPTKGRKTNAHPKVEQTKELPKDSSNCDTSGAVVKPQESGAPQLVEKLGAIATSQTPPVSNVEEVQDKKLVVETTVETPVAAVGTQQLNKETPSNAKSKSAQRQNSKNATQSATSAPQQQPQAVPKQQQQPQAVAPVPAPQPPKSTNKTSKKSEINMKGAIKEGTDMDAFNDNISAKNEVNANNLLSSQNDLLNANTITAQQNDAANKTATSQTKQETETNANSISNHKLPVDNEKPQTIKPIEQQPQQQPITANHAAQAISTATASASAPKAAKGGFDVTSIIKETPKIIMPPFPINHNNTQDEPDRAFVATDRINANHVANNKDTARNGTQLQYPEGHWAPTNPDGKRKYDKEFLLMIRDRPACKVKPTNLPESVNAEDRSRMIDGRLSMGGRTDFTNPPFQGYGGSKSGSQTRGNLPKQRNSQSKMGGRASEKGNKPIPKVSISLKADVKLHETENAWKPARFDKGESMSEDDKKKERLYRKVRSVLNKLTPQKFSTLVNQVRQLDIDNKERLQGVIDLVFEKAIDEPNFSVAYAMMCKELQIMQVPADAKPGDDKKAVAFRTLLVTRCQAEFEKQSIDESKRNNMLKAIDECLDAEKKKELEFELQEYDRKIRMRSVGCIRFIGELFKQQMLTASIMKRCLQTLLTNRDEESLECLCKLLTTVGKELESKQVDLTSIFDEMRKIGENKKPKVSSRIKFMLQDVLDLKDSKWIPRRNDMNPKTIDQIQKEAEVEHLNIQVANMTTPRKDDRGGGGGGGSRPRGQGDSRPKMSEDGWNPVASRNSRQQYTIQTDKLRNKVPSIDEPISLGSSQSFATWGKGSLGSKNTPPPTLSSNNMYAALENIAGDMDKKLGNSRSGYNSKGPSMERSGYKSSYDGRNANSRSGSQQRSVDNSTPMRPSSSTVPSNPPVQQQMPAPSRPAPLTTEPAPPPKMSEEQQLRRIHNSLDEYLNSCCTASEFWQDVISAVPQNEYPKVVNESYNKITEKSQNARLKTGELFASLIHQNLLPLEDFCSGFEEFLAIAEDLEIDIPKIWAYIAENIVHLIYNEVLPFSRLKSLFRVIIESGRAKRVLKPLFDLVISDKGPIFLKVVWQKSQVQLSDFMPVAEVDAFIADNKLGFLIGGELPVGHSELTYEQIHDKLMEFFKNKADFDEIVNWISANVGDRIKENKFIRVLATAIFEDSISKNKLMPEVLGSHGRLIQKYVDTNVNLELQCLYALQALVHKLEHPQGLLLAICDKLYDTSTFSQESFIMWEGSSDPAEQGGKGVALKQLTSFFTQLKENEEDDEYSSNSEVDA